VAGAVAPSGIETVVGATVTFEVSLLASDTVTPPAGAGVPKVTANEADWPNPTDRFAGKPIIPGTTTITLAVVSGTFGRALAWIVADPAPMPVTGTVTLVALAAKLTLGGTVATAVLLELRLTAKPPAGAGVDRFRKVFCVPAPLKVRAAGENAIVAVTCTVALPGLRPYADALTIADPKLTPLTRGAMLGLVSPARMMIFDGFTVTVDVSPLVSVTITPPAGAGCTRVT
jgi:hypothetical protein